MPFLNDLSVTQVDPSNWRLNADLEYQGNAQTFTVPAATLTNFASSPRPFWWLVPRYGRYTSATVLHDWLTDPATALVDRCDADGIFRRTLREAGVAAWRRWLMWGTVRIGGGLFDCGIRQFLAVAILLLLAGPFALVAFVFVSVLLAVFYLAELFIYLILLQTGYPAIQPTFYWWT